MINILIVEDNNSKYEKVKSTITGNTDLIDENIDSAKNIKEAKKLLYKKNYDLMILDLVLPIEQGDTPTPENGVNFLDEINSNPQINPPIHIIGLTQFAELKSQFDEKFHKKLWHLIDYQADSINWQDQLKNILWHLIKIRKDFLNPKNIKYNYDVGIVTALTSPELEKVLELENRDWKKISLDYDSTIYHECFFRKGDKKIKVVAASADCMGMPSASTLAMKLIQNFRPKYIIMVGICAGIKGNHGDIIIADKIWDYGSGKQETEILDGHKSEVFKPYINQIKLNGKLFSVLDNLRSQRSFLETIQNAWPLKYDNRLSVYIGAFASGSAVIANERIIGEIKKQNGQLVGFDMEAYSLFHAATHCTDPKPTPIVIKSIADFGDSNKNNPKKDELQGYAAFTSVQYTYNFIINELF